MKRFQAVMTMLLAITLASVVAARAQYEDKNTLWPEPPAVKVDKPPQNVVLGGRLNDTGDIFVPDNDLHSWKVNNPNTKAVKSHRNEHIQIQALQDFRTGSLTVQSAQRVDRTFSTAPSRH